MQAGDGIRMTALAALVALSGASGIVTGSASQTHEPIRPEFEPDSYQPRMLDAGISVAGPVFEIEDVVVQLYSEGENEQIFITGELGDADDPVPAVLEISFFDDEDTPDETIELWVSALAEDMDALEIVDVGLDGDVFWYYVTGERDGLGQAYYIQVQQDAVGNVDVLQSILTVDGAMADALRTAQDEIEIGDDPFLDDVDPGEMEQLIDGGPFRSGDED